MRFSLLLFVMFLAGCATDFEVKSGGAIDPASFNLVQPIKEMCQVKPESCDEPPVLLAATAPQYPSRALASGRSGHAEVHVVIDETGSTSATKLLAATAPEFGTAAMNAVRSWRFEPARKSGRPVPVEGKIVFPFVVR